MVSKYLLVAAALSASASAATSPIYGQCGGKGYTGPTSCASGSTCVAQNPYYSQCLAGSGSGSTQQSTSQAAAKPVTTTKAATSTKAAATSSKAQSTSPVASSPATGSGTTYKASFTEYGSGDQNNSGNCNVATTACGFYSSPGYSAAVSQNEFGVGPGAGAGPACGTCWKLTAETDSSGNALPKVTSIVVQVTNLCPASGNPLCSQNGLTGTNQYGANLNFDLCIDSGASAAIFNGEGTELALGTAVEVSCSEWTGTIIH